MHHVASAIAIVVMRLSGCGTQIKTSSRESRPRKVENAHIKCNDHASILHIANNRACKHP